MAAARADAAASACRDVVPAPAPRFREAEVADLQAQALAAPAAREQHVPARDVTVDHALGVKVEETGGGVEEERHDALDAR